MSNSINDLVHLSFTENDYATHNFQWYVNEQIEEEKLASTMNDKLEMIGDDKAASIYLIETSLIIVPLPAPKDKHTVFRLR